MIMSMLFGGLGRTVWTGVSTRGVTRLRASLGVSNPAATGVFFTFSKEIAKQYAGKGGELLEFELADLRAKYTVQPLSYSGDYKIDDDVDLDIVPPKSRTHIE